MHVLRLMPQYHNIHACREKKQGFEAGLQTKQAFRVIVLTSGSGLEKGWGLFFSAPTLGKNWCGWQTCLLELPKEFHCARLNHWLSVHFLPDRTLNRQSVWLLWVQPVKRSCPFSELSRNFSSKLKQTQYLIMQVLQIIRSFLFSTS